MEQDHVSINLNPQNSMTVDEIVNAYKDNPQLLAMILQAKITEEKRIIRENQAVIEQQRAEQARIARENAERRQQMNELLLQQLQNLTITMEETKLTSIDSSQQIASIRRVINEQNNAPQQPTISVNPTPLQHQPQLGSVVNGLSPSSPTLSLQQQQFAQNTVIPNQIIIPPFSIYESPLHPPSTPYLPHKKPAPQPQQPQPQTQINNNNNNNNNSNTPYTPPESETVVSIRPHGGKRYTIPAPAREILTAWLENNVNNPYPSEEEKDVLVRQSGVPRPKLDTWFINARRRYLLRKPSFEYQPSNPALPQNAFPQSQQQPQQSQQSQSQAQTQPQQTPTLQQPFQFHIPPNPQHFLNSSGDLSPILGDVSSVNNDINDAQFDYFDEEYYEILPPQ